MPNERHAGNAGRKLLNREENQGHFLLLLSTSATIAPNERK